MACIVLLAIKSQSNPVDSTHDCTHCQASHCACMTSTGPLHWTLSRLVFADHWAVYAHNDNPWMGVYFCEKQVIMKHTHITHGQTYFVFPFPWMVSSWPVPNPHHQYERCRAEAGYSRVADLFQHLYKKKIECRRIMIKVIKTTNKQTKKQWTEYCSYKLHPDTSLLQSDQTPHTWGKKSCAEGRGWTGCVWSESRKVSRSGQHSLLAA